MHLSFADALGSVIARCGTLIWRYSVQFNAEAACKTFWQQKNHLADGYNCSLLLPTRTSIENGKLQVSEKLLLGKVLGENQRVTRKSRM